MSLYQLNETACKQEMNSHNEN